MMHRKTGVFNFFVMTKRADLDARQQKGGLTLSISNPLKKNNRHDSCNVTLSVLGATNPSNVMDAMQTIIIGNLA